LLPKTLNLHRFQYLITRTGTVQSESNQLKKSVDKNLKCSRESKLDAWKEKGKKELEKEIEIEGKKFRIRL
jgi:hypothetical protein